MATPGGQRQTATGWHRSKPDAPRITFPELSGKGGKELRVGVQRGQRIRADPPGYTTEPGNRGPCPFDARGAEG